MKKLLKTLFLAVLISSLFAGCSIKTFNKDKDESKYSFYYLNAAETTIKSEPYTPKEETKEFMVKDLLQKIGDRQAPEGAVSLLPEKVSINSYDVQKDLLIIDFSKEYSDMGSAREVLTRAGILDTLIQIPDIQRIRFTVNGKELTDSRNKKIEDMTEDTFVEYNRKDSENYRYDTLQIKVVKNW